MQEISSYLAPRRLDEALKALAGGNVTVFCGGTDLSPQTESGAKRYRAGLMNLRRIEELAGIEVGGDQIRIGAATTITEIRRHQALGDAAPLLAEAADRFASDQIRNAASLGGNLCNASPASDMSPALLALNASVELGCWREGAVRTRLVALENFFVAPGRTVKRDDELMTAVVFDRPPADFVGKFRKSGPRPALEISTVSVAVGGRLANGGFHNVRVALGSVAPTPLRARRVEAVLEGRPLDALRIAAAVACAGEDARPIDDVRASAWYRDHLVRVFIEEVLNDVSGNQH